MTAWAQLAMTDVQGFVGSGAPWRAFTVTVPGTPERFPWYAVDLDVLQAAGWTVVEGGALSAPAGSYDEREPRPYELGPCWVQVGAGWSATFARAGDGATVVARITHVDCGPHGPVTPAGACPDGPPWRFAAGAERGTGASPWRAAVVAEAAALRAGAAPFTRTPERRPPPVYEPMRPLEP